MQNDNGFTFIEVIIASTILLTAVATFLPIVTLLDSEEKVLSDRRSIANRLHDELLHHIWIHDDTYPFVFTEKIRSVNAMFEFTKENEFIKGCAQWTNVKNRNETFCLYGLLS